MNRSSQQGQRQPGQTPNTTTNSRLVWIGAAVVATVAWSLQLGASLTCSFVTVQAHDGEILAITADSAQVAQRSTSWGLQCSGDFYDLEDDHHWKLARSFSLVALAVGVLAWLWTVWNGMVALIVTQKRSNDTTTSNTNNNTNDSNNDDTTPNSWTTTSVAVVSCLAALLQLPALVVWESVPCTEFSTQQECRWAMGSSVWVCSVVAWVAVAILVHWSRIRDCLSRRERTVSSAASSRRRSTTGTSGPWWSRVVVLPKLAPADTTWEEEEDDDDDHDVERGGMKVVREYDPIFAAGFCQSDDDPADTRKQRGGGGAWSNRLRIGNWWQRLAAPHSQSPSQSGLSSAEASISPSLTSTSTTRIVKRYSFAVPPAVLAAAHQMGRRSVEEQDEQDEEEPGNNDTPNKNDKDQADSWYATPWSHSTPWFPTAFSASNEDHNNNNDDPPSDEEEDDRRQEARVHHNRSLSTTSLISAHESMLDTLTGEESLLDHDDDDSSSSSSLERNRDRADGLAPNQEEQEEEEADQDSLALDKEDEEKDFGPHPFSTNTDQLQPELTKPRVVHLPDNHNNNHKATDPTTTSTNHTGRLPRPGIFARLQRYKRLSSDDDDDDDDDEKCLPLEDNDDDDSPPPMMEVTFQTNSSEETSSSASSPERHLKLLSEEWKDLFQEEEDPAQETSHPDLERRPGDNDNDMLEMDPAGPPSISTDGSEDDEPEPYFSSSEPETDDDDDDDTASPRRGRRRTKVLHPPRRRRRYHTGTTGSSVSSNHSLLSCTIQEETEEDLQQEKGGASGDPTSPNSTERRSRSPQPSILRRTQSSPDLSRLHQAATDSTMTSDSPTYLKDHSAAAANRHDDDNDDDDMGTLGTNPSSIWTGPRQLSMSSSQDQRSSQDQDAAVVANHTKDDDEKSASPSSVSTGPHLRKRRSQSLEVRRKRPLAERGTTTNLWKRELEHRASIHQTRSYLSSSSSSSSASSEAPETTQEDAEATSPRGRARRARVQRLQQEQSRRLGHNIGSSSSRGRRNSPTYTRALTPKRYLAASPTRAAAVVSPNSTPKRGSGRRGRTASPSVQDRSCSSTASDNEPRAMVDPSESFLLDSLDLSLARSARKQGHEYGSDEDSI